MTHRFGSPDFSVKVEGRFVAPGLWLIHAAIEYGSWLSLDTRRRAAADARIELLRGVIHEARRGWDLRARNVRVFVEGDHQVAGLFEVLNRESVPAIVA